VGRERAIVLNDLQVFRSLSNRLPNIKTIEMQHVSPKLMAVRDLSLIVPGSYANHSCVDEHPLTIRARTGTYEGRTQDDDIVKISHFLPTLTVLASKQRPCKLTIMGSDGKEYPFLLKGTPLTLNH
jgi:FKBP12-rapamycin complex-associated protein